MFDSKLFQFAEAVDLPLLKRVANLEAIDITLNESELEQAKNQRFELFDLLGSKLAGLKGISRNMMQSSSSNNAFASEQDNLNLWFLISNELEDIQEIQNLISTLDRVIFNTLGVSHE